MIEWMIVAVFFLNGVPVQADANLVDPRQVTSEEECKAVIPKYSALVKERYGFDTVAECRRIFQAPPPAAEKPKGDPGSELKS